MPDKVIVEMIVDMLVDMIVDMIVVINNCRYGDIQPIACSSNVGFLHKHTKYLMSFSTSCQHFLNHH